MLGLLLFIIAILHLLLQFFQVLEEQYAGTNGAVDRSDPVKINYSDGRYDQ